MNPRAGIQARAFIATYGWWPRDLFTLRTGAPTDLNFGGQNVIAVRLAPEDESSRWYPGAGIYRNIWLVATGPVHVAHWGTYITTPEVSCASATVDIQNEIRNRNTQPATVTV